MTKSSYYKLIWIPLLSLILLFFVGCSYTAWVPEDGIWYCKELQTQLAFGEGAESYAIVDNQKIVCQWSNDKGSTYISLVYQGYDYQDYHRNLNYQPGDVIYAWEFVDQHGDCYYLKECESGTTYLFKKIK